jgi:transcriptional regulator with XRE-family HTH domain
MNDISYMTWDANSDAALIKTMGAFIRHHRLQQNKTQERLAAEAGIVRSTLSLFERGENTSMLVFVQLLRALKLLYLLQEFQVKPQVSPLQLAKLEQSRRIRAHGNAREKKKPVRKSTW